MGSESAKILLIKLTSMPIVREVFSKITESNVATKNILLKFTSFQ